MRFPFAVASAAALTLALSACGSGSSSPESSAPAPAQSAEPTVASSAEPDPTLDPAASAATADATPATSDAAAQPVKTAINKTITDPLMGDKIVINSVVRNFPIPDRLPAIQDDHEFVLVNMTLTAGTKFYAGVDARSMRIVTDDGTATNLANGVVNPEMTKAGYVPLPDERVEPGKNGTGWVGFLVASVGSKTLTLRYTRSAATVMGSKKTIPEKVWSIPLAGY